MITPNAALYLPPLSRGEVLLADFGGSQGKEQKNDKITGTRLCVVVQSNGGNQFSPTVTVAPISSIKELKRRIYQAYLIGQALRGPLSEDSLVKCEQLRTLDRATRISKNLGKLPDEAIRLIDAALRIALDLR